MDLFAVSFLVFATIILGGIVVGALAVLLQTRGIRRNRLEMKQHVQRLELTGR